jgi:uncharacterized protein (DUF1015 family)
LENLAIERMKALGIGTPDILLPKKGVDLKKWAVVACDQYTSELDYWERVSSYVGDEPSTLHLIFPEVYLEKEDPNNRIATIQEAMKTYNEQHLFETYEKSFFLVHRKTANNLERWGLIVALDLDQYDYNEASRSPIRATEGTILSRIPPRKLIRKDVPFELPHILVLINDMDNFVIEPLKNLNGSLEKMYETDLMENGGQVTAYRINNGELLDQIATTFEKLHATINEENPIFLAIGDGNHSLATAKACWEDIKTTLTEKEALNHPARYALAEIVNIYDSGLLFEPIHRVLFNIDKELFFERLQRYCESLTITDESDVDSLIESIGLQNGRQRFGYVDKNGLKLVLINRPVGSITAATLQLVLDSLIEDNVVVDYIHGEDVTLSLGSKEGNIGLLLPGIEKETFFDTIISDGSLPRKTFSMGDANDKRFYLEARKIK